MKLISKILTIVLAISAASCSTQKDSSRLAGVGDQSGQGGQNASDYDALMARFWRLNLFGAFVKSDIVGVCSDIEGRSGAGRDIFLMRFSANGLAKADVSYDAAGHVGYATTGSSVFAGRHFSLLNGSVGDGARGAESREVLALSHFNVGNIRGGEVNVAGDTGAVNGQETDAPSDFPFASYVADIDSLSSNLVTIAANAQAPGKSGADRQFIGTGSATVDTYRISASDLGQTWTFTGTASRIVILVDGSSVNLDSLTMIGAESQYVVVVAPRATDVRLGGTTVATRKDYYLTLVAPQAAVAFHYGRIWGGIYAASLNMNPANLPWSVLSECGAEGSSPSETSGGQINERPFVSSIPGWVYN